MTLRHRHLALLSSAIVLSFALLAHAPVADAARVLVLQPDGHVIAHYDPLIPAVEDPPPAMGPMACALCLSAHAAGARPSPKPVDRNVRTELARLYGIHAISSEIYHQDLGIFNNALDTVKRLGGTRAAELEAVIENVHSIAAAGMLTPSRLPALFLTIEKNRIWWTTGPLLSSGGRVQFPGSQLVWEYYPGQGIELQVLGSFGPANSLYNNGPRWWPRLRQLLAELIPLAAQRGGGLVWEYYFGFGGGTPPWTSAMSQGTAIQALADAYKAFQDPSYLRLAQRGLAIFRDAPPTGVNVPAIHGRRYLQYSFDPFASDDVINGFLQSLIGLYDYAKVANNAIAWHLFRVGDAEARAELPSFDTGAWSLYQPGQEDSLDYHRLVTGFLQRLCDRTHQDAYCKTAARFQSYLTTPPALTQLTTKVRSGNPSEIFFRLSKISHVGIAIRQNGQAVFLTSGDFPYGVESFSVPALSQPGDDQLVLTATDSAGNFTRIAGTLQVTR